MLYYNLLFYLYQDNNDNLNELESKAREFEVLSSVNLSKILQLLENKEKKIGILQKNEDKVSDYVQAITKLNE